LYNDNERKIVKRTKQKEERSMIYKTFDDTKPSALGMGCMRLPTKDGEIDVEKTKEMVAYAMQNGVNYFDTAWLYHGGKSESVMGEVLSEYPRQSFYLATKFPVYDMSTRAHVENTFETQLKKCRVDYFDFYLLHNVCEATIDAFLDPQYKILDYLAAQKKNGRIRHLGFSAHGSIDTMKRFLDVYGEYMEFCQLQVNWLDWDFQNAKGKMEMMKKYGIPVWVMEPVRGGTLARLPKRFEERLTALRPDFSMPEWSFRFLQGLEDVCVTLSGMSNMEQLKENIKTYEQKKPLTANEQNTLFEIAHEWTSMKTLPCTACHYCVDSCPKGIDIPRIIELYNEHIVSNGGFLATILLRAIDTDKKPSECIGCHACESLCPQNIKISEMMSDFAERIR
jgi:predicted aldo/keto reductase-like oxidoreductase